MRYKMKVGSLDVRLILDSGLFAALEALVTQDPFKLHPLPPSANNEWDDGDSLEPDEEDAPPPVRLSRDEELEINERLMDTCVLVMNLRAQYDATPALPSSPTLADGEEKLRTLIGQLRHFRPDLISSCDLTDAGTREDEDAPVSTQKIELTSFPLFVGRDPTLTQLTLKDHEVPALRGVFYQVGSVLVFQDLGAPGGTLLERRVGGKLKLISLKGEPCPLAVGDRLSFGAVQTQLTVRSFRNLGAGSTPADVRICHGLAPSMSEAPPRAPEPPPAPVKAVEPPPPPPVAIVEEVPASSGRTSSIAWGAGVVVAGIAGVFLGLMLAPKPPPPPVITSTPVPVTATTRVVEKQIGASLAVKDDGTFQLVQPKLTKGAWFVLLSAVAPEQPDPFQQGVAFALGQVSDEAGNVQLVYAPAELPPAVLAAAPAREIPPSDPQIALFTALKTLQDNQPEEADKLLNMLVGGPTPPVPALKALGLLALNKNDGVAAQKHLRAALERNASDPEVHLLLGRLYRQRFLALAPTDTHREMVFDDARSAYEEALRLWVLPPSGGYGYTGHELGLKGEDLLTEYLQLLTRMALKSATDLTALGTGTSAPAGSGAATGTTPTTAAAAGQGTGTAASPTATTQNPAVPEPKEDNRSRPGEHATSRVPGGPFTMGGDVADPTDEQGLKGPVTLRTFSMDRYEVSNQQFEQVFPDHKSKRGKADGDRDPAVNVTWDEAQQYCRSVGMRLPTESEWEKAARGTDGRTWPWGDTPPRAGVLNYRSSGIGQPTAVDSYPEGVSPYGIFNLAGNVWEWTADWYDSGWYSKNPQGSQAGPTSGQRKVIKGASFAEDTSETRASNRASAVPSQGTAKIGFRCVRDG